MHPREDAPDDVGVGVGVGIDPPPPPSSSLGHLYETTQLSETPYTGMGLPCSQAII